MKEYRMHLVQSNKIVNFKIMKAIKNIFIGFLVSFIGSIPLGYLNVIGFEIYSKLGVSNLILFYWVLYL
jgi:hypothetical protein